MQYVWPQTLRQKAVYRIFEIFPAALTWATIIGSIVFSLTHPLGVAVFIILYDLYWLIKSAYIAVHLVASYRKLRQEMKIDWRAKVERIKGWEKIYHLLIFPALNESQEIINGSITAVIKSSYPSQRMIFILAIEERAGAEAKAKAAAAQRKFGSYFKAFLISVHPANLPNEIIGKGSNIAWAGHLAQKYLDRQGIAARDVITTCFDIDTVAHRDYFANLTYHFLTSPKPYRTSYQPVPLYHNNLWEAPALTRLVAATTSFWQMVEQGRPERLVTFSSHSMSERALAETGFWPVNMVSEDSRIFWQCLLYYDGDYYVQPMFLPVSMDTCLTHTYHGTMINQYKQLRRWAWGAENMAYTFYGFIHNPKIPWIKKWRYGFTIIEGNYTWATSAIIISLLGWLPLLVGGQAFEQTVLANNLMETTRWIMILAMAGVIVSAIISTLTLPPRPPQYPPRKNWEMVLQWVLAPVAAVIFSSLPAIDAQTRLAFKKWIGLGYWVTPKARKLEKPFPGKKATARLLNK